MAGHARVLVVSFNDDPTRQECPPARARLALLVTWLVDRGDDLALVTRPVAGDAPEHGAHVVRLAAPPGPPEDFEHLRRVLPSLIDQLGGLVARQPAPDVLVAHGWAGAVAAHAVCQGTSIRLVSVVDERASGDAAVPGQALARLEASVAGASDAVLAGSSAAATQLVRRGVARRRIHPLAMPVMAPPSTQSPGRTRPGSRVAVLANADAPGDAGVARALRAVSHIDGAEAVVLPAPPAHPDQWTDYWAGPGRDLDEAAVVVHVPDHVPVGHEAVVSMSRAAPLVASATGAHLDIVEDTINGRLVSPHSTDDLVHAVRDLLDDPFAAAALGVAAHDRVHQRHSVDRVSSDLLRVVELVTRGGGDSADEGEPDDDEGDENEATRSPMSRVGDAAPEVRT